MAVRKFQDQLKQKKRQQRLFRLVLAAGAGLVILGGVIYSLFFTEWFTVRTVTVTGPDNGIRVSLEAASQKWLDEKVLFVPRRANSYWFNLAANLSAWRMSQPKIDQLQIGRTSRHDYSIAFTIRQAAGIWCVDANTRCYFFDETGIAYQTVGISEGFLFTQIKESSPRALALGDRVTRAERLVLLRAVEKQLQAQALVVTQIMLTASEADEFNVQLQNGPVLKFSFLAPIEEQLEALKLLLKNQLTTTQLQTLNYIDLRIPGRIYWK